MPEPRSVATLASVIGREGGTPEALAVGLGAGEAGVHAVTYHRPLELSEHGQHAEQGTARGRRGVE
ncbi:MAG: hypothetical protein JWQ89_2063 [Devosia sp.]|nr:hypothetical protein [Devosia sp.]